MSQKKYMNIKDFIDEGYLLELNRRFLHPLGVALEATRHVTDKGESYTLSVWDSREDPEGIYFDIPPGELREEVARKAQRITDEWLEREPKRRKRLGYMIQPLSFDNDLST